jgi:hypothetical protein
MGGRRADRYDKFASGARGVFTGLPTVHVDRLA